jgi:hypothetical protein
MVRYAVFPLVTIPRSFACLHISLLISFLLFVTPILFCFVLLFAFDFFFLQSLLTVHCRVVVCWGNSKGMKRMMGLTMHGRQSPETNHVLSSSNNLSTSSMPQRQRRKLSPKRTCPTLLMNDRLIMGMAMVWMAVILYGESLSFSSAAARCGSLSNPHYMLRPPTTKAKILGEVTRIALISDPQLTSPYSYDWMKGRPYVTRIVEFFSDIYMRRAYQAIQTLQQPEVVFFTGDLFDGVTYNLYREKRFGLGLCYRLIWIP